jgi:hypothetical protein
MLRNLIANYSASGFATLQAALALVATAEHDSVHNRTSNRGNHKDTD